MNEKFAIYRPKAYFIRKFLKFLFCLEIISSFFSFSTLYAQPNIIDIEYSSLNFLDSDRSVIVDNGKNGYNQGSVHRYNNLLTQNGKTVYGLLTVLEIENAVIENFDNDFTSGNPGWFQPGIGSLSSTGGYVVYQLKFFDALTDEVIFLDKFCVTGIDVDGTNPSNREFVEYEGFTSYVVNDLNQQEISDNLTTGRTRFLGRLDNLPGIVFENTCSNIVRYAYPTNSISFVLGQTGQNSERNYSLQFGQPGGVFTNPVTTINPFLIANDDVGTPVNSDEGGIVIANVLSNDLWNGQPLLPSEVSISLIAASHSGVTLNSKSGAVKVSPETPAGNYSLSYKICSVSNPDDRCDTAMVFVRVLAADLSVLISDEPDSVMTGQDVSYTISVVNNGPTYAQNVVVNDILPIGLSLISTTPSIGKWDNPTWNIGKMAASTSDTLKILAKVTSTISGNIQSSAKVTSSTYDPLPLNNSVSQVTTVTSSANLSITITKSSGQAIAGQNIRYLIEVTNEGPGDAQDVVAIDNLPLGLNIIDTDLSSGTWNSPKWTIGTLKNGASVTLEIEASTNSDLSGMISNSVTVISSTPDAVIENNSSTQVSIINKLADLSVSKIINVDSVVAGEIADYSVWVSNNGPSDAESIQLTDIIPPEIQFVLYNIDDGVTWNFWESSIDIGSLKAGDSTKILIIGTLDVDADYGLIISNALDVSCITPDPDLSNNNEVSSIKVTSRSDMSISLTGPSTIVAGTKISYTLSTFNHGPSNARALVISDVLPSEISNAEFSLDNGTTWQEWLGTLSFPSFNLPGTNNILLRGDVASGVTGNLTNKATLSSSTLDTVLFNNSSTHTTTVVQEVDLILSMVENISPIQKNGQVNYTISVFNNGHSDAPNVTITDNFDPVNIINAIYFNGSSWVTWTGSLNIGTIQSDSTKSIQIIGTIANTASDPLINTVSVTSSIPDLILIDNSQTMHTPLEKEADLSVIKTGPASVNAGEQIQYFISVTNNSSDTYAGNIVVSDVFDDSRVHDPEYSVDEGSNWFPWSGSLNIGTLNHGSSFSFTIRGRVYSNARGNLKSTLRAISNTPDPYFGNNILARSTSITVSSNVSIVKTILNTQENIVEGSSIRYQLTYKNSGPSDADNFFISDVPSAGLIDLEVARNSSSYLPWFGSISAGTFVAGGTASLIIRGIISGDNNGTITNTAFVACTSDPDVTDNSSQISTPVVKKADLMISMSGLPNPVIAGETLLYTLSIKNNGPSSAENVNISNVIPTELQNGQYSINGGLNWNSWTGLYHLETIPAGGSFSVLIRSKAKDDLPDGSLIGLSCSVGSSTNDPKSFNNSVQLNTSVQTHADLSIAQVVDVINQSVGDLVTFTLTATNNGTSKASSVFVYDSLPSGFIYVSDNGFGAFNPATGNWVIGDLNNSSSVQLKIVAKVLSSGIYSNSATIEGGDLDTDYLNNTSVVSVNPDIEAMYSIAIPQNVDSYIQGQLLATVNDGDGNIVAASLTSGTLPPGTVLNSITGRISVSDSTFLKAGSYIFLITTTDEKNGKTTQPVEIVFNRDYESVYYVASPRNEDDYATGEILASASDADGKIMEFDLVSGILPPGTLFNEGTGEISIFDASVFSGGNYSVTITSVDETGGKTTQLVSIVINSDSESKYVVNPPILIENYVNGDTLAYVRDDDGEIIHAELVARELPDGSELNTITGDIIITNSGLLKAGTYTVRINTIDDTGGFTSQLVKMTIENGIAPEYAIEPSRNIDTYRNSDTLAYIMNDVEEIVSAFLFEGDLPPGTALDSVTGEITVSNSSDLVAGSYSATIEINKFFFVQVDITINPDFESIYIIEDARNLYSYSNGDVLASVTDENGPVVSVVVQFGTLPQGVGLNQQNGEIVITDTSKLVTAIYTFYVKTTDVTGGTTSQPVTISFIATDLSITQTCIPEIVTAGENLTYRLTVTNNGSYNARGVKVTDLLPAGLTIISTNPSAGNWISPVWDIGNLAKGSSVTMEIEASTQSSLADTISNTATVTSLTSDPIPGNNSSTLNSTVITRASLNISLTASPNPVNAGENITYILNVVNSGPSDAENIVFTDDLPANVRFVSASDGGILNGSQVRWNLESLQAKGNHSFSLEVNTGSNLTSGTIIVNGAVVKSDNSDGSIKSENIETLIKAKSDLSIQKIASSKIVPSGENFTYTIIVKNNGPSDASNITITDELPSDLAFVSASNNGFLNNGVVTWLTDRLVNGGTLTYSLLVTVRGNVPAGTVISNKVMVRSNTSDGPVESEPEDVLVKTQSNLSILKNASAEIVRAGENLTYTIIVANNGPSDATNVSISDELPSSLTFVSASGNGIFNNGVVSWLPGKLAKGANYSCTVVATVKGNVSNGTIITNEAIVNSDTSDGLVESEPENVKVESYAELELVKTASSDVVIAGNEMSYSIYIHNAGPSDALNVTLADTLPQGLTFVSASDGGVFANGVVTWHESLLAWNLEKVYSVTARVSKDVSEGTVIRNIAYVESDNSGGKKQSASKDILIDAVSDLIIRKSAVTDIVSGEPLIYSFQLTNNGPSDAHNVLVSDIIPEGLSYTDADGGAFENGVVSWNFPILPAGTNQQFTLTTNVDQNIPDGTQIINIASAICNNSTYKVESNTVLTTVSKISVQANDDNGIPVIGTDGGMVVDNVLVNDLFKTTVVDPSLVTLSQISSSSDNISLNIQNGEVKVLAGTAAGTYNLVYRICLIDYPNVCDEATVHITVLAPEIVANNDTGIPLDNEEGGVAIEDITKNDLLNGTPIALSDILITLVNPASVSGISLDNSTGKVTVETGTAVGTYLMTYRICEKLNPTNCDEAEVSVTVISSGGCEILVPTAFSPNDDGIHDHFKIRCIEKYPDASLEVFNRWGNLVYKKEKYGNVDQWGDAEAWWDGYSNRGLNFGKEKLPPGTYFFILKLNNGAGEPISGSIFLNR